MGFAFIIFAYVVVYTDKIFFYVIAIFVQVDAYNKLKKTCFSLLSKT